MRFFVKRHAEDFIKDRLDIEVLNKSPNNKTITEILLKIFPVLLTDEERVNH